MVSESRPGTAHTTNHVDPLALDVEDLYVKYKVTYLDESIYQTLVNVGCALFILSLGIGRMKIVDELGCLAKNYLGRDTGFHSNLTD